LEEFELLEGVAELFAEGEAAAAELEAMEAAEVENSVAIEEVASGPAIAEGSTVDAIRNFINTNPYGQALWKFTKWALATTAGASAAFGIMYGLNKAIAQSAHDTGKRKPLSEYLRVVGDNWVNKLHLTWTADIRQHAAEDALAFPWIDATA